MKKLFYYFIWFFFFVFFRPSSVFAASCTVGLNNNPSGVYHTGEYVDVLSRNFDPTPSPLEGSIYYSFPGSSRAGEGWTNNVLCYSNPDRCASGAYYPNPGNYTVYVAIKDSSGLYLQCGSVSFKVGSKSDFNFSLNRSASSYTVSVPAGQKIIGVNLAAEWKVESCGDNGITSCNGAKFSITPPGAVYQKTLYSFLDCSFASSIFCYSFPGSPWEPYCEENYGRLSVDTFSVNFNLSSLPDDCELSVTTLTNKSFVIYYSSSPSPPPPPPPLPNCFPCTTVWGYVKDPNNQKGIPGASVSVIWSKNETGGCWLEDGCCSSSALSNAYGRWSVSCSSGLNVVNVGCVRVVETPPAGYRCSPQYPPTGPCGWPDCEVWGDCSSSPWTFAIKKPTGDSCGPITFYNILVPPSPWFQTKGGDVHAGGTITSQIPNTVANPYFSLVGDGGYPGVVSWENESLSPTFGSGEVSQRGWLANTSAKRNSYEFFYQLLGQPTLENPPAGEEIKNGDLTADGVKAYNGNIKTGNEWQIGTKKIVILTSGKFLIKHRILVDQGGSLVVIAKEGIGVSKNLIATGEQNNYLGGVFITDGTFYSSVEEDFIFTSVASDKVLVIKGGVIANDFSLTRDLGEENNPTAPAEQFVYRPDFWLNSYPGLWKGAFIWTELAP